MVLYTNPKQIFHTESIMVFPAYQISYWYTCLIIKSDKFYTSLAVVPPLFSSAIPGVQLKGAARELASGLRFARDRAITRQQETTLGLNLEEKVYRVTGRERSYPLPDELKIELFTVRSEQSGDNAGAIRFFPDGSSTGGRITLAAGGSEYEVDVDWLTGRVKILD